MFQLYQFISVGSFLQFLLSYHFVQRHFVPRNTDLNAPQSAMAVRVEGVLTQLIFDHALKIRMREDGPATGTSTPGTATATATGTPSSQNKSLPDVSDNSTSPTEPPSASTSQTPAPSSPSTDTPTQTAENSQSSKEGSNPQSNLTGRINNLMSSDLDAITEARNILFVILQAPLEIALCVWFLWTVLGVSSLVGLAFLLLGLGVPGRVAVLVKTAQIERMKATDERVQDVSESEPRSYSVTQRVQALTNASTSSSICCHSYDQDVWLGRKNQDSPGTIARC